MATGPFDHPRGNGETRSEIHAIMQEVRILLQVIRTLVHRGALRFRQVTHRCPAPHSCRHVTAAPAEEVLEPYGPPDLGFRCPWGVEGVCCVPPVLQNVDQIEHDPQLDTIRGGDLIQQAPLRRVAIDERHPLLDALGSTSCRFVERLADDLDRGLLRQRGQTRLSSGRGRPEAPGGVGCNSRTLSSGVRTHGAMVETVATVAMRLL
jgi:hypothetical protein